MKKFDSITEIHPELIQLWETAWKAQPTEEKAFDIPCETPDKARTLRQMLYTARKKLLKENYQGVVNWNKLEIRLKAGESVLHIIVPPWVKAANAALVNAGVTPIVPKETIVTIEEGDIPHILHSEEGEETSAQGQALRSIFNLKGERKDG